MAESQQQRRSGERAQAGSADGSGPHGGPHDPGGSPPVVEIELARLADEEGDQWYAQWHSPDDDGIGDLTSGDDLAELVADILDAIRVETDHSLLSLEWELVGDRPPDGTVAGVVAELGVILPGSLGSR